MNKLLDRIRMVWRMVKAGPWSVGSMKWRIYLAHIKQVRSPVAALIGGALASLTQAQSATNTIELTWTHHTLSQPFSVTVPDPRGGPNLVVTNLPTTFWVYRSFDLATWTITGSVVQTNKAIYTHTNAPATIYFAVTASNSFAGETFFSPIGVGAYLAPANDLKGKKL